MIAECPETRIDLLLTYDLHTCLLVSGHPDEPTDLRAPMSTPQLMDTDSRIHIPDWESDPPIVLTMPWTDYANECEGTPRLPV